MHFNVAQDTVYLASSQNIIYYATYNVVTGFYSGSTISITNPKSITSDTTGVWIAYNDGTPKVVKYNFGLSSPYSET